MGRDVGGLYQQPGIRATSSSDEDAVDLAEFLRPRVVRIDEQDRSEVVAITKAKLESISRAQRGRGARRATSDVLEATGFNTLADLVAFVAAARGVVE